MSKQQAARLWVRSPPGCAATLRHVSNTTSGGRARHTVAREGAYFAPEFRRTAYHCQYCNVLAPQKWDQLYGAGGLTVECLRVLYGNCRGEQIWVGFSAGEQDFRMVSTRSERSSPPQRDA